MTKEYREKLIKYLRYNQKLCVAYVLTDNAVDEIVKALEQQPCEDCISRQAVFEEINRVKIEAFKNYYDYSQLYDFVDTLSPVKPQENCISKQAVEEMSEDKTISNIAYILDSLTLLRQILNKGDCNGCKNKDCRYKPKLGQMVRYNCPFYKAESEVKK